MLYCYRMDISHQLIFLDTETTGNGPEDRLIQVAYTSNDDSPFVDELYTAPVPITIEAMSVHHITPKMTEGKPPFQGSKEFHDLEKRFQEGAIMIAHNAPFDAEMLKREGLHVSRMIDTLKIAHYLDPEGRVSSYKLQFLRYLLGIEVDAVAHDAKGDVLVLEQLFYRFLKKIMEQENLSQDTAIEQMLHISETPLVYKFFPFGKYKNTSITDVLQSDRGYLEWLLRTKLQEEVRDENWIYTLEQALGIHQTS